MRRAAAYLAPPVRRLNDPNMHGNHSVGNHHILRWKVLGAGTDAVSWPDRWWLVDCGGFAAVPSPSNSKHPPEAEAAAETKPPPEKQMVEDCDG